MRGLSGRSTDERVVFAVSGEWWAEETAVGWRVQVAVTTRSDRPAAWHVPPPLCTRSSGAALSRPPPA